MRSRIIKSLVVLRRVVAWGAMAPLCLFLVALAINARDELPSSETWALLQVPRNPYRPEENIYFALAGLDAPAGQSAEEAARKKIDDYNARVDAMLLDPLVSYESLRSSNPLKLQFKGKVDLGLPRDPSFWAASRENGAKIDRLVDDNRELYERYLTLHERLGYFETERTSAAPDLFTPPSEIRNLFLAKFAYEMQTGDEKQKQSSLIALGEDIHLWLRMLTGEGALISKMIAVAYLQNDYLVLSDMIADPNTKLPINIDSFLPEFDLSQWNIGKVFASEFRFHSFIYTQTRTRMENGWQPTDSTDSLARRWFGRVFISPIGAWFFKFNATENVDARLMNELAGFAAIDPTTFTAQRARYKEWESDNVDIKKLRTIYNPVGKMLVAMAAPVYAEYPLRPYDAAALQRLVRLSVEIRRQQIVPSAIPAFMKLHPQWSTHPADGRSFGWNPTTNEIAIHTIAKQMLDRRFSVQIWRKPAV